MTGDSHVEALMCEIELLKQMLELRTAERDKYIDALKNIGAKLTEAHRDVMDANFDPCKPIVNMKTVRIFYDDTFGLIDSIESKLAKINLVLNKGKRGCLNDKTKVDRC